MGQKILNSSRGQLPAFLRCLQTYLMGCSSCHHQLHLVCMAIISEAHAEVGYICLVDVIAIRPRLPVVLVHPVHLDLQHVCHAVRLLLAALGSEHEHCASSNGDPEHESTPGSCLKLQMHF